MACIYQDVNKLNGHMYIGLTKNLQRRHNDHCQAAKNPNSRDYNLTFHKALRKYGAADRDIISELYQESGLNMRAFVKTEECYVGYGTLWNMINHPEFYDNK